MPSKPAARARRAAAAKSLTMPPISWLSRARGMTYGCFPSPVCENPSAAIADGATGSAPAGWKLGWLTRPMCLQWRLTGRSFSQTDSRHWRGPLAPSLSLTYRTTTAQRYGHWQHGQHRQSRATRLVAHQCRGQERGTNQTLAATLTSPR